MTTPGARNGFTLVEVLAALVVLGLVLAGLGQGIRFGLLAWSSATMATSAGNELDATDRTLRHLIARMHPGNIAQPAPYIAAPGSLAFVSALPDLVGAAATRVEAVLLVDVRQRLVLRWRPFVNARRLREQPFTEVELLPGVAGMELAFWRPETGWSDASARPDLPALIRIRLSFNDPARRWPELVMAPGLDRP